MGIYIGILVLTIIISSIALKFGYSKPIRLGNEVVKRRVVSLLGVLMVTAIFVFFFAARWNVGTDYMNYYTRFLKLLNTSYGDIIGSRDWGYYLLTAFWEKTVSSDYFVYSLFLGVIIYLPIVLTYRKYSSNFVMTCALYIMLCLYTWPYNGMRQSIAVSLLFVGYPLLYEKKNLWKYALLVLVAFVFHSTALLVAPFILLIRLKPWKTPFVLSCVCILFFIIFMPSLWSTVIQFLENIGQDKMASDYSDFESLRAGVSILRVAVAGIPVFLSFIYYDKIKARNPHIDIVVNMCVMNLLFLLCGYRLTVVARFATFFNIGLPLLIPEFVNVFNKNSRKLATVLLYVLFFLHMITLLPNDSGLIPYRFIFENL